MDIGLHHVAKCSVHGAMSRNLPHSGKLLADHVDVEMTAPVTRAGMAGMTMTVVFNMQVHGSQ